MDDINVQRTTIAMWKPQTHCGLQKASFLVLFGDERLTRGGKNREFHGSVAHRCDDRPPSIEPCRWVTRTTKLVR